MLRERTARPPERGPGAAAVIALTILAAALRFAGIGHQGVWFDEAYTVMLVKGSVGHMLATIPRTESTPYLYYVLAWFWTHLFGRGAADLRALSAVLGVGVIPVAHRVTLRLLGNRRAAVSVAALAACNPLLIWYSQEARAYELLVLTSAVTLLAFARARERPSGGRLAAWVLACAIALVSHYDAALVIVPEAIWLLGAHRRRPAAWLAALATAACGGALLPLLIEQSNRGNASWIRKAALNDRLGQILPQFLVGTGSRGYRELAWLGFALGALGLLWLARAAGRAERRRAAGVGAMALGGFALVMAVDAAGSDTVLTRNLLALWLPLAILLAAGFAVPRAGRLGIAATAALCAIGLTGTVSVATVATLQRPDWAAVARALGPWPRAGQPAGATRLLVFQRNVWLESLTQVYMTHTSPLEHGKPRRVTEIDIIANRSPPGSNRHWLCWWGAACNLYPSRLRASYDIPGFRAVSRTRVRQFRILRLVSARPRRVYQGQLKRAMHRAGLRLYGKLIQRP
ncbi:MAG TPA: glycosyltransferase family 39 protein [Solirubrobacteraceae bacterium]|nr:glycosyltransferase family 39 protein [Solirubrobacteraceae bacterium]